MAGINEIQMVTINISLNEDLAEIVEKEMKEKKYASKSEFFRDLLRRQYVYNTSVSNKDYYKTLDNTMGQWANSENNDLFKK